MNYKIIRRKERRKKNTTTATAKMGPKESITDKIYEIESNLGKEK